MDAVAPERGSALFLVGGVRLAVVVTPYRGSLDDASTRLHNKLLRAEEKKDGAGAFDGKHHPNLRSAHAENLLASAVDTATRHAAEHVKNEDFEAAMRALSRLRAPVDAFFTDVTVNDSNPLVRKNRLQLLNELRSAMHTVADFSKISG